MIKEGSRSRSAPPSTGMVWIRQEPFETTFFGPNRSGFEIPSDFCDPHRFFGRIHSCGRNRISGPEGRRRKSIGAGPSPNAYPLCRCTQGSSSAILRGFQYPPHRARGPGALNRILENFGSFVVYAFLGGRSSPEAHDSALAGYSVSSGGWGPSPRSKERSRHGDLDRVQSID